LAEEGEDLEMDLGFDAKVRKKIEKRSSSGEFTTRKLGGKLAGCIWVC